MAPILVRVSSAREPRHHRADRHAEHFGDVAIRQVVDVAQHDRFAERLRQRGHQAADGLVVMPAHQFRFRRSLRLPPERLVRRNFVIRALRRRRLRDAARELRLADVAQDRQQPGFHGRPAIGVEMAQRPQEAFLHGVVGIRGVAHQITGERVRVVEKRQRRLAKSPRPVGVAVI
jgi:signal recognition particle subunit SEC65